MRLAICLLAACRGAPTGTPQANDSSPQVETGTAATPFDVGVRLLVPTTPTLQAAEIGIEAPAEALLTVQWTDGQGHTQQVDPPPGTERLPILGLRPSRTYTVTVTATVGPDVGEDQLDLDSQPIPASFPDIELLRSTEESHFTLIGARGTGTPEGRKEMVLVIDQDAELVYWFGARGRMNDARIIPEGIELFSGDIYQDIVRRTWLGEALGGFRPVTSRRPPDPLLTLVDAPGRFHHDYLQAADGSWFALSKRVTFVPDYPGDYELQTTVPSDIAEGVVHHFANDGSTLGTLFLGDVLPMTRIGFDSLQRTSVEDASDWTHENAIAIHPDGDLLVSLRHQDAIVKVDPDTQELDWILGNPSNWPASHQPHLLSPVGDLEWPYHQHAVTVADDGTVLMFDNGNYRTSPGPDVVVPDPSEQYSRVVGYQVDPAARTVTQVIERLPEPSLYAEAVGDVDPLPDGHLVGHFGLVVRQDGTLNADLGLGDYAIRLIEWDPKGDEVWAVQLTTDRSVDRVGWSAYRSERFSSFYGGWVSSLGEGASDR